MRIVSSFLPPVTAQSLPQSQFKGAVSETAVVRSEQAAGQSEPRLPVPVSAVAELETLSEQAQQWRKRIDLRALREENIPFNNLRALASYQTIAAEPVAADSSIARLDVIV